MLQSRHGEMDTNASGEKGSARCASLLVSRDDDDDYNDGRVGMKVGVKGGHALYVVQQRRGSAFSNALREQ